MILCNKCGLGAELKTGRHECPCGRRFKVVVSVTELKPVPKFHSSQRGNQAGVIYRKNRWEASIGRTYLGRFARREDAIAARKDAEARASGRMPSLPSAATTADR